MAGKGVGDAAGPIKTGINIGQKISETLFPQTKQTFKDYWSGDIAKGVVNSEDGIFTSNFWTGDTTVFRSHGKKFYFKEGNPIMIVKQNGKQIGYAHVKDFLSNGLGTDKIYKSLAEVKNKYGSGLFDTVVGTAVDGFVHYGLPLMGKKAVEMGRYGASELMRNKNLQKKAVNYGINKLTPFIQYSVGTAMDQLSTKARPNKKYKTNRKDLDGRSGRGVGGGVNPTLQYAFDEAKNGGYKGSIDHFAKTTGLTHELTGGNLVFDAVKFAWDKVAKGAVNKGIQAEKKTKIL